MEPSIDGRGSAGALPASAGATQERQLRLALAMRGGVSLAVWIGGGVREIDRLRRAFETGHPTYKKLLELNRFNDVIVDVLSGASAGGLNAVLYAASQIYDFDAGETRAEWMRLADIEPLTRETTAGLRAEGAVKAGFPLSKTDALRPPSLMRGDAYFFTSLERALTTLVETSNTDPDVDNVPRIDMQLSATLVEPTLVRRLVNARTAVLGTRSKAMFRFRQSSRDSEQRDLIAVDLADRPEQIRRLAMAARSTSSFPIAFEPATIVTESDLPDDAADRPVFPGSLFEVPGTQGASWQYVMDGGVLDNIPVGKAIGAIVDAPADGPTERWLCYLHPSPTPPEPRSLTRQSFRSVQTTATTLFARFNQESLLEDVDELLGVNDAIMRRNLLRESLLSDIDLDGEVGELNAETLHALEFARMTVAADKAGIEEEWQASAQAVLLEAINDVVDRRAALGGLALTELADATALLIAFAREVENAAGDLDITNDSVSSIKSELYRQGSAISSLVQREAKIVRDEARRLNAAALDESSTTVFVDELVDWFVSVESERAEIGDALERAAERIRRADVALGQPFSLIDGDPARLWRLIRVLLPVQLIGRGPWTPINFVYIRGDARTPLDWALLESSRTPGQPDVEDRLAGNTLANFSAFLSSRWRANDWMWGRLDAASTLVDALIPAALLDSLDRDASDAQRAFALELGWRPGMSRVDFVDLVVEEIQLEIVADERDQQRDNDGALDAHTWVANYAVGAEDLGDLPENTRLRIGARTAVIAFAAFRPAGSALRDRAIRLALSAVKPLYLVAALLLVSPLRGVMSLAIGGAALQSVFWVARETDAQVLEPRWVLFGVAIAIAFLASVLGAPSGMERRRTAMVGVRVVSAAVAAWALTIGASGRYQVLTYLGIAIAQFSLPRIVDRLRRRDLGSGFALWLIAAVAPGLGIAVGWHFDQPQNVDLVRVLVPCVAAIFTVLASHIWATGFVRFKLVVLALSSGLGMLLFVPGERDGWMQALWLLCAAIAIAMVGTAFVSDSIRLRRYAVGGGGVDNIGTYTRYALAPVAVAGIIALAAYREWLSFSFAAWSAWAVVAASYAVTLYGTFSPIFPDVTNPAEEADFDERYS